MDGISLLVSLVMGVQRLMKEVWRFRETWEADMVARDLDYECPELEESSEGEEGEEEEVAEEEGEKLLFCHCDLFYFR